MAPAWYADQRRANLWHFTTILHVPGPAAVDAMTVEDFDSGIAYIARALRAAQQT